jgi:hypothetical protein
MGNIAVSSPEIPFLVEASMRGFRNSFNSFRPEMPDTFDARRCAAPWEFERVLEGKPRSSLHRPAFAHASARLAFTGAISASP